MSFEDKRTGKNTCHQNAIELDNSDPADIRQSFEIHSIVYLCRWMTKEINFLIRHISFGFRSTLESESKSEILVVSDQTFDIHICRSLTKQKINDKQ